MDNVYIYGAGGFGKEVLFNLRSCIHHFDVFSVSFIVDDVFFKRPEVCNVKVIKRSQFKWDGEIILAIGSPKLREKTVDSLLGYYGSPSFGTTIHSSANISPWVKIGEGAVITSGCIVTCNITIGKYSQLNLNTTIGHDCSIGDFFTTAPGVHISGNCTIGHRVYFGTNSCIKEGLKVCSDAVIGMGAVVIKDILEPGVYVGNPAKKIK